MEEVCDCDNCFYFVDDGGELFGENPNCIHPKNPKNIDRTQDGEIDCPLFMEWENRVCTLNRHELMQGKWAICPDCQSII